MGRELEKINVWTIKLPSEGGLPERSPASLSEEEWNRAMRFLRPIDAIRFVRCYEGLRSILSHLTGLPPGKIRFRKNAFGKPELADISGLHFSLSRSNAIAVVAAGPRQLGIDVEFIRPIEDVTRLAREYFTATEVSRVSGTSAAGGTGIFYQIWARKEAIVKALGTGLSIPIDTFDVSGSVPMHVQLGRQPENERVFLLTDIGVQNGYAAALAEEAGTRVDMVMNHIDHS